MKRTLLLAVLLAALPAPAAHATNSGPDWIASDNVKLTAQIKTVGDGVGARIVGPYMYVTTTKSLSIFDIKTDPEHPRQIGQDVMDVEFENEEVPTNGKILGISGQIGCPDPGASNVLFPGTTSNSEVTGCLTLYDVSKPDAPTKIKSVGGAGQHTSTCLYDCTWIYGSTGAITDNRDPKNAKVVGNWQSGLPKSYKNANGDPVAFTSSCHHLRELEPGYILGSCEPIVLMSTRPEDGGSVMKPVILNAARNADNRFIHSGRWPNTGHDKFILIGGETNFQQSCTDQVGAFMVWDASAVNDGNGGYNKGATFKLLSEVRPTNGTYQDGHAPDNALGCSVHWFQEHPTFKNGGLVALAEYENGDRFLQITPAGKIIEQGWFLPLGGSTSAPHWNPYDPTVVYSIDYARGVDVLKYTGSTYVPTPEGSVPEQPGATPGTAEQATAAGNEGGTVPSSAPCEEGAGFTAVGAKRAGRGVRFSADLREGTSFDVTVTQVSRGRSLINKRISRSTGRKGAFTFNRAKGLRDGRYVARFVTKTKAGTSDVRLLALRRKGGRWVTTQPFAQEPCGPFTRFALSGPAFGGAKNKPLTITYKLRRGANSVRIEALIGKKVYKRVVGGGAAAKTYRFRLSAKGIKRGTLVKVRAVVNQGSPVRSQTIYARRI